MSKGQYNTQGVYIYSQRIQWAFQTYGKVYGTSERKEGRSVIYNPTVNKHEAGPGRSIDGA